MIFHRKQSGPTGNAVNAGGLMSHPSRGSRQMTMEKEMPKYRIEWDAGYGLAVEYIDAPDQDAAEDEAYSRWREDMESQASYAADILTREALIEDGEDPEDFGFDPVVEGE